jgi:flagellar motor switch protein FliN/FliY
MDAATAARIANDFLLSAFSSLEALLGAPYTFKASDAQAGDKALLARWCAEYPVWMHARIAGGGAVVLLWPMADAARVVAAVGGEAPSAKSMVSAADLGMVKELTDAIVGGGAAGLSGVLGETIQTEQNAATIDKGVEELSRLLGADPTGVEVKFESGGTPGRAVLAFSRDLETRVAKKLDSSAIGGGVVSDEEMKDILTGLKPEDEPDRLGRRGADGLMPENLSVVMDIELTATARLGKVEVSLAEVLNYGPGSIIELGHLVDEPIELLVNGKLVARGDVVVVDERFGIRITEITSQLERIESLR